MKTERYPLRQEEKRLFEATTNMQIAFEAAGVPTEPDHNPWPSHARLIRGLGEGYSVHAPNPNFPEHGDVWHPEGRYYSERALVNLVRRNQQGVIFVFERDSLANRLGFKRRFVYPMNNIPREVLEFRSTVYKALEYKQQT